MSHRQHQHHTKEENHRNEQDHRQILPLLTAPPKLKSKRDSRPPINRDLPCKVRRVLKFDDLNDQETIQMAERPETSGPGARAAESSEPKELAEMREEAAAKWNFDFQREFPIIGEWLWTKLGELGPEHQPGPPRE